MRPPADPGELLKRHRERRGLSARKAAEAVGGNHVYWSQVERGVQRPSRRWVVEAAGALDLTPSERGELMAAFGHAPAVVDQARPPVDEARRRVGEAARLVGASPAQLAAALEALGIPTDRGAEP
jgi:transcriptional regulator with XRE-family HTH domain